MFATRTPRRINPVGLSLIRLLRVDRSVITFTGVDLLDGTPVIDLKPYVTRFDQPPGLPHCGWFDEVAMQDGTTPASLGPSDAWQHFNTPARPEPADAFAGRGFALDELGKITLAAGGDHRTVITDNNAGMFAAASGDALIAKNGAVIAKTTYRQWLARWPGSDPRRRVKWRRKSWDPGSMSAPPDDLPCYRVLTGPDDAAFCRRVSEAIALGYRLHEGPAVTFNGEQVIVAQALLWPAET
jgi:hypothetical protein